MRLLDQAIVLKETDWSETSQLVTLLTLEHGKVRGLAKGSKRTNASHVSQFSGGFSMLTLGQAMMQIKPASDLAALTEWDLTESWPQLRRDWSAWQIAHYAIDLTGAFLADHDPHPALFESLANLLTHLGQAGSSDMNHLLVYQWKLLSEAGYQPVLDRDVRTQEPWPTDAVAALKPVDASGGGGLGGGAPPNLGGGGVMPLLGGVTLLQASDRPTDENGPGPWPVRQQTIRLLQSLALDGQVPSVFDSASVVRANRLLAVYARWLLGEELATFRGVFAIACG